MMKTKIIKIGQTQEGLALPEEFLRALEITPGAEVELRLDLKKRWIIIKATHGADFTEHFKESMETMA